MAYAMIHYKPTKSVEDVRGELLATTGRARAEDVRKAYLAQFPSGALLDFNERQRIGSVHTLFENELLTETVDGCWFCSADITYGCFAKDEHATFNGRLVKAPEKYFVHAADEPSSVPALYMVEIWLSNGAHWQLEFVDDPDKAGATYLVKRMRQPDVSSEWVNVRDAKPVEVTVLHEQISRLLGMPTVRWTGPVGRAAFLEMHGLSDDA